MKKATIREVCATDLILNEIFMAPSAECFENRFDGNASAADCSPKCSGKCKSPGGCMTYLPHD